MRCAAMLAKVANDSSKMKRRVAGLMAEDEIAEALVDTKGPSCGRCGYWLLAIGY
ncbi:hypothetical protein [Polaromonas sp.]|uniref:hypothetical protein n=1 Tax=Polaromonas sp. TaxID=1869339 RepID=UPI003BB5FC46